MDTAISKLRSERAARLIRYLWIAFRLAFALWYFGVGFNAAILQGFGDAAKDAAEATTGLERAMAESHFMNPLLILGCFFGGGALLFQRTSPLGLAILAPIVICIFCFHLLITHSYVWGTLNLLWMVALVWHFRHGFKQLWSYKQAQ